MKKLIIILLVIAVSGCGTITFGPTERPNDANLSCEEIQDEIDEQNENKKNALLNSLIIVNTTQIIKNAGDRIAHLEKIAASKNCDI